MRVKLNTLEEFRALQEKCIKAREVERILARRRGLGI